MAAAFPLSCATSSLNPFPASTIPLHDLPSKLNAIANAGFKGIELAFPDLLSFACQFLSRDVDDKAWDDLCVAAKEVKTLCQDFGLEIMMLQPFSNFEGWEKGSKERKDAFERAKGWIRIMQELGTDMLQVGSTDTPNIPSDKLSLAADLAELCDMLSPHGFCLAYENWCWATQAPTWRDVYEIVQLVDRPNIGLCLDTFQTAGYEWGDPTTKTGRVHDLSADQLQESYLRSLEQLSKTIPKDKIYLLQISDAYKPSQPFHPDPDDSGARPRARWSFAFRPMPGAAGAYLPTIGMAKAVARTGFRGWFSAEIFDGGPEGKGLPKGDLNEEAEGIMKLMRTFVKDVGNGEQEQGAKGPYEAPGYYAQ
ncbi:MAG: hypothetical protein Q9160_003387 [Pyrenula sp. 1 TL-2023]